MRVDGNSAYDREDESRRKWNYRYTMVSIIAILVIAAAAMIVFDRDDERVAEGNRDENINDNRENHLIGEGGLNVVKPVPTVDSRDTPAPAPKKDQDTGKGMKIPVQGGAISKGYSGDELVYNATLDQYVVHLGVDIEAAPDTPVTAVKGGTVTKVYNDDRLGITIEISHGSGLISRYCNLSTDRMVEEGDVVEAGDVISGVGITALLESSDPPHLHFEVLQDGIPTNPEKLIDIR